MSNSMLICQLRVYLANPSVLNLYSISNYLDYLLLSSPSEKTEQRVKAFRGFLYRYECQVPARQKFKVFAAREYLIRFTRPACSHWESPPPSCRAGYFNDAEASSAHLPLTGRLASK